METTEISNKHKKLLTIRDQLYNIRHKLSAVPDDKRILSSFERDCLTVITNKLGELTRSLNAGTIGLSGKGKEIAKHNYILLCERSDEIKALLINRNKYMDAKSLEALQNEYQKIEKALKNSEQKHKWTQL